MLFWWEAVHLGVLVASGVLAGAWHQRGATLREAWLAAVVVGLGSSAIVGAYAPSFPGDAFAIMRLLAWVIFVSAPLVTLALMGRKPSGWAWAARAAAGCVVAVGAWSFLVEPTMLEVRHVTIPTEHVDAPYTIAVIADIQTDHVGAFEAHVLDVVTAEAPDLILWPGDYIQTFPVAPWESEAPAFRALLAKHHPPATYGGVAVPGDMEPPQFPWVSLFEGTGTEASAETFVVEAGPVTVTGVPLRKSRRDALVVPRQPGFHIVVGHAPDFAMSPDVDADLMVAGHTHGGQVQLPLIGPLMTLTEAPRAWAAGGLHDAGGGRHVLVSRGVGMERAQAPRLRFLSRPEVVIVHLVPAE